MTSLLTYFDKLAEQCREEFAADVAKKEAVFERYLQTRVHWLKRDFLTAHADVLEANYVDYCKQHFLDGMPQSLRPSPSEVCPITVIKTVRKGRQRQTAQSSTLRNQLSCLRTTRKASALMKSKTPVASTPCTVKGMRITRPRRTATRQACSKFSTVFNHQSPVAEVSHTANLLERRDSMLFSSRGTPIKNPIAVLTSGRVMQLSSPDIREIRGLIDALNAKLPKL